jgi:cytochrome c553
MKRVVTLICGLVFAGAELTAQGTPAQVDAGKKAYDAKKCSQCHTVGGKGGTLTKLYPLDGVATKLSAADLKAWVVDPAAMEAKSDKKPKLKMSSKKAVLTDADVTGLVAYMLTLKEAKAK